nr:MAG TPA_asm: hypothetical protein [Caudoviricetes sp.]
MRIIYLMLNKVSQTFRGVDATSTHLLFRFFSHMEAVALLLRKSFYD